MSTICSHSQVPLHLLPSPSSSSPAACVLRVESLCIHEARTFVLNEVREPVTIWEVVRLERRESLQNTTVPNKAPTPTTPTTRTTCRHVCVCVCVDPLAHDTTTVEWRWRERERISVCLHGTPVRGGSRGGWNVHSSMMSIFCVKVADVSCCKETSSNESAEKRAEVVRETGVTRRVTYIQG